MDDARYAKRARQACEPCRKKSKCPGERPICSYCQRLGQQCVYNAPTDITDTQSQATPSKEMPQNPDLGGVVERFLSPPQHPALATSSHDVSSPNARLAPEDVVSQPETRPASTVESPRISIAAEAQLIEMGRLYITWCHGQPITLFAEETFLSSLAARDPELILSLESMVLRFPPVSMSTEQPLDAKAKAARQLVMDRVAEGRVELSTLQSLCLLSMVEFASGNATRAGLNLTIASHLAHSIPPSSNPQNIHERTLCFRSIVVLQNLQGCITPATKLRNDRTDIHNPAFTFITSCAIPEMSLHQLEEPLDKSISTLACHFSITWRLARMYAASRVGPDDPPPWDSRSDYSMVMQSHHSIDCRSSVKYRFACNRIADHAPDTIQAQRQWWMPFLFIQFVHETIPCLLNHPFLLSMRLRSFRQTVPVPFMQQSLEAINRNARWVLYFMDVLDKKGIQVCDPVLAHCVVVVATIHLQHSFVEDQVLRGKAKAGFEKCMNFLRKMATIWPSAANMLQESIVMKPSPDQPGDSAQNRSFSIDSQLLWNLLIYDRAVRPDAEWDQSMFGSTLRSDVSELSSTEGRATEFDLVGSAGISRHKAMPNEAAVWPPDEETAPASLPESNPLPEPGWGTFGPSFEDIFFEGVGPFGDQVFQVLISTDLSRVDIQSLFRPSAAIRPRKGGYGPCSVPTISPEPSGRGEVWDPPLTMPSRQTPKDAPIVIVGAGVFGLSTALELTKRGYSRIAVLDRFLPPVPDGSSVDISRIIRVDYADPVYSQMAREAYQGWNGEYSDHFHESSLVILASRDGNTWLEKAKEVAAATGQTVTEYEDANLVRKDFPSVQADVNRLQAMINHSGGWADAKGAIAQLASQCSELGVQFVAGARGTVTSLKFEKDRVVGVEVLEGPPVLGEKVILATGAWTNRILPVTHASSASGQPVGFIQITDEEAERLKDMPVMINLSTGVFIFPPTKGKNPVLKIARHGWGYATEVPVGGEASSGSRRVISAPKRDGSNAASGYLPDDADDGLREGLRQLVPEFADRPWSRRRLCWYSDTPEGDFIMDYHPFIDGLFFATGGAGHAFKFLPVLGKYISDCFEEKAPQDLRHKWRLRESDGKEEEFKLGDGSRAGPPLRKLTPAEQAKLVTAVESLEVFMFLAEQAEDGAKGSGRNNPELLAAELQGVRACEHAVEALVTLTDVGGDLPARM
ncbi:hypothetical protein CMUS01_11525 [Colletotrichum musicola]|uniref:Zn(2)-C6 fungal-type domain-containing protein n=1 Tax=Colletotrichum musicola TaxID=2175873 RepID=A0A8H6N5W9_9PEZI|nr:hypothetical protein CMUS01_11525 [Colletotrichum musicola]